MSYKVRLETANGSVHNVSLPSKGAVAQFISTYPNQIPIGISMRVSCDALCVSGIIRGKKVL
jgi:hypothetical protein